MLLMHLINSEYEKTGKLRKAKHGSDKPTDIDL